VSIHRATRFLEQYAEEAPAYCGTFRACVAGTAAAATMVAFGSIRRGELRAAGEANP
jgi:hypothetical protein